MPVDHNANQKGGPPDPYPLPNPQVPTRDMTGIGKVPITGTSNPPTTDNSGVSEKEARAKAYRTLGTKLTD